MNPRTRARHLLGVSLVGAGLATVGCPGSLEDPARFELSLTQCGPKVDALLTKTCAVAGCHTTADRQGGLDLQAPDVPSRLLGVVSSNADCTGKLRVDPADVKRSLFYTKLLDPPACGARMPFLGKPLAASDIECVKVWIESFRKTDGGAGPLDASTSTPDGSIFTPVPVPDAGQSL